MLTFIKEAGYYLYQLDWEKNHAITPEMKQDEMRNYAEAIATGEIAGVEFHTFEDYTFEDYLFDYGYAGMIYVSFDEFLDNEYLDTEYMKELFDNDKIYQLYLKDIEKM